MAQQDPSRIVEELMAEPHVEGHRISVLQIHELVEEADHAPQAVADRYDLDVADVYRALAYYHEHPDEMQRVREHRDRSRETAKRRAREGRPADVTPPGDDGG